MARRIMLNGTSYFGQGAIQEIVNEIKNRHFKKALVTSTPDLFEFKVATKVTDLLDAAGIDYEIYDGIKPNPTIENVTAGVDACKAAGADVIVAVGGGSPIDTSKAIATIITNHAILSHSAVYSHSISKISSYFHQVHFVHT